MLNLWECQENLTNPPRNPFLTLRDPRGYAFEAWAGFVDKLARLAAPKRYGGLLALIHPNFHIVNGVPIERMSGTAQSILVGWVERKGYPTG